ncbi:MAG: C69 family dipeptidase [Candidatus Moduliflexus flocculans]|nr:C69 family dipeptidase [Candidatus Moduliflexus flocculans]
MEICSVGPEWTPESGKPGAIWAARRVPDDHVVVIANYFRIREIRPQRAPTLLASPNVHQGGRSTAAGTIRRAGRPFIWQEAYAPAIMEGNLSRIWLVYEHSARRRSRPGRKRGPHRCRHATDDLRPARSRARLFYPWSFKPEKKISVRDVIAFQRSAFAGHDLRHDLGPAAWMVLARRRPRREEPDGLALHLRRHWRRSCASAITGRSRARATAWSPSCAPGCPTPVGGVYWVYVDNPKVGPYVPIYAGVSDVSPLYKTYDFRAYSEDSARWAYDFVEKLALLRWQAGAQGHRGGPRAARGRVLRRPGRGRGPRPWRSSRPTRPPP